jgi:hypothetical protein
MPRRKGKSKKDRLDALKAETDRALMEQIHRLLAWPMNRRTHFLRRRTGFVGSSL